jgi:SAM-dependent methyltransferase
MVLKVNLGCGNQPKRGFVQLDRYPGEHVDIVHDLNEFPYPFETDSVDEIWMFHVLEHLPDTCRVLEEIHRILKLGAVADIFVPYYNSVGAYTDPTHVRFFTLQTFDYFEPGSQFSYYSKARFKILKRELRCYRWGKLIPNIPVRPKGKSVRGLRDIVSTFIGNVGFDIHFRLEKA